MTLDDLKKLADSNDLPTIIYHLNAHPDPNEADGLYIDLVLHAYWQQKNIQSVITLATAGITYTRAHQLPKSTKALTYNLASFCWPGWQEPGITLTEKEIQIGQQAAQQHADISQSLNPTPIVKARTAWILGAHHLTAKQFAPALAKFNESAAHATAAANEPESLLAHGYAALTQSLESNNPTAQATLTQIKSQLLPLEDGPDLVRQLENAEAACKTRPVA
jgi:hypothetical protein